MGAALVLNATYEPLCVVPLRRAVVLVLAEKAIIVESTADVMHSERLCLPVPPGFSLRFSDVPTFQLHRSLLKLKFSGEQRTTGN